MKLTDKCLKAFNEWLGNKKHPAWCMMFEGKGELTQNAYYIDFFDSIGIYINAIKYDDKWKMIVDTQFRYKFDTRPEAINKAIEKANQLYNLL